MIQRLLNGIKRRLHTKEASGVQRFLQAFAASKREVYFVQIGANDGKTGDPIFDLVHQHHWQGLLVEPVPYLFDLLRRNYGGAPGLTFECVAVSDKPETKAFYYIADPQSILPAWMTGVNSFDKRDILWHEKDFPEIARYIVEAEFSCVTYKELLQRHNVRRLDLLVVDVEGFDYDIVKQIAEVDFLPGAILFEHKCLTELKSKQCFSFLNSHGYKVFADSSDAVAILEGKEKAPASQLILLARQLFAEKV